MLACCRPGPDLANPALKKANADWLELDGHETSLAK
jgi:hypothetical protein